MQRRVGVNLVCLSIRQYLADMKLHFAAFNQPRMAIEHFTG